MYHGTANTSPGSAHSWESKNESHACKWVGCYENHFPSLASLVTHVSNNHLMLSGSQAPARYTCLWEGCSRFNVDQPSRFALISHCRTHTGEKPYFCPIPECEKHFTRSDALAKHVKGVHDLHQHRDAIGLMRYRVDKGKAEPPATFDLNTLTDEQYSAMLNKEYELRVPWWFSKKFTDAITSEDHTLQGLYDQQIDTRHVDLANIRYRKYLEEEGEDELITSLDVQSNLSLASLQEDTKHTLQTYAETGSEVSTGQDTYSTLMSKYTTASKIHALVKEELNSAMKEKRRLWALTQILLDANVKLGLIDGEFSIQVDDIDEALLSDHES